MSGRDLVRDVRSTAKPSAVPGARLGIVDLLVAVLAVIAVGSLAYFGYASWFAPRAPQPPAAPSAQLVAFTDPALTWTDEDTARCRAKARAASDDEMPADTLLANRAVTDGFGPLATMIECRIATKSLRFCDPKQKAALIAMINDYLVRVDMIRLGMGVQGAPMAVLGEMFGGEIEAGSSVYEIEKDGTFAFMQVYHARIAAALQRLGRDGLVSATDFATFMGTGVPATITAIFDGVVPQRQACAG
jgi:hypothetical protein